MNMRRVLEPELMEGVEQARAYADADFDAPHDRFMELLEEKLPVLPHQGQALDLGCGSADISLRFVRRFLEWRVLAVDAAPAMLNEARRILQGAADVAERIELLESYINAPNVPERGYDCVFSNSLLHHLPEPQMLWVTVLRHVRPSSTVFIMDLIRPRSEEDARRMVREYAANEPEILQRDFYCSLCAAFSLEEVQVQLAAAGLPWLALEQVSDRHLVVCGSAP
ncbi:MAG: class I SAM-dependent methyltransferase [Candidatus Eutrophobiaceae bacterium]